VSEAGQASSSFDSILNECLELFAEKLKEAVHGMLEKADESLVQMTSATQNRELQKDYQEARKVIGAGKAEFEKKFFDSYLREFQKKSSKAKNEQSFADIEVSLSLVEDTDLEEAIKYKEVAAKMRKFCDEELAALDQRIGVLLGDAALEADANPFGPETIGEAFQQACKALETTPKVREVMRRLFDDNVVDEMRSIYKAVNALLVQHSILPKIRYGVSKKPEGAKGSKDEDDEEEEEASEKKKGGEKPSEENIFAMLQNLVAQGGGGGGGGGVALPPGAVILQGAELVGSLNNIQQQLQALSLGDANAVLPEGVSQAAASGQANVLKELKQTTFGAQMQGMDAATLDIVSLLFDQLFDDPKIPVGLKGLIGRLQIPMLKVAIADKELFSRKTHPARQLLDTFGEVAVRLGDDFSAESPTFVHLEAIIGHLVANFQEDVGVFERAREQLKEMTAEHDKKVEEAAQVEAKRIEQAENLSAAKSAAEDEVKLRVQAHKLPGAVLEFLIQQWLRYLLILFAQGGRESADWKAGLETMDTLIASLEPVKTPDDKKKLASTVPVLVRKLVVGMNRVGTEQAAREQFLGELMKYHTVSLAKPKEGAPPPPPPPAPVAATPEQLDFTAPVSVPDASGKAVEVVSLGLDFTPKPANKEERANRKMTLMSSLSVEPPAKMEMGSWVEFRPKEDGAEPRACKVLFVSPKKTRYLFSDRRGKDVIELSRAEIVRRLRTGEVVRLDEEPPEPLFDRFMHGVIGKMKSGAGKAAAA
jgi:exonuclease VII small subunit